MRLFFSGQGRASIETDPRLGKGTRYRLFSCHESYFRMAVETTQQMVDQGIDFEVMYDSGAFTAWSKGHEVDLNELIQVYGTLVERFLHKARAIWLINLDKIPGSRGRTATPQELDEAIVISDRNFEVLEKQFGKRVLPVYHQNESQARLFEVAKMAEYICASPRNDVPEHSRIQWSKEVHALIPNRTHGLAATGYRMMTQTPWWSVDSATWVMIAAYGGIYVDPKLRIVSISDKAGDRKDVGKHFHTLSPIEKEALMAKIHDRGFVIERMERDFAERATWNRLMMTELYTSIKDEGVRALPTQNPLFDL